MNFSKSFTYIFDDPDWFSKLILPILCSLIPVIGTFIMAGYVLHLIRNVAARESRPLPELNFGEDLGKGFKWFIVMLVYTLPLILFVGLMVIPISVSSDEAPAVSVILGIICGIVVLAYAIFLWLLTPVAQAHLAVHGTIASGFEISKFTKLFSKNFSEWLLVLVGGLLAALIAPAGGILFFIGALITGTYAGLVVSHLIGQAYAISTEGGPYRTTAPVYAPQPPYNQPYSGQYYQPPVDPQQTYTPVDEHQPYNMVPPTPPEPVAPPVPPTPPEAPTQKGGQPNP